MLQTRFVLFTDNCVIRRNNSPYSVVVTGAPDADDRREIGTVIYTCRMDTILT